MYLIAVVVDYLRELEDVGLVANKLLLLLFSSQLDFVLFEELLKESNGECWLLLSDDVVLGGDLERGKGSLDVELLIVERNEGLIDFFSAAVGRALSRDGSHFLLALFLHLCSAVVEDGIQLLLPYRELILDLPVGANRILDPGMCGDVFDFQPF